MDDIPVGAIHKKTTGSKPSDTRNLENSAQQRGAGRACSYCGKTPLHARKYCEERDATCRICGKMGHFQSVCCSSTPCVRDIHTTDLAYVNMSHEYDKEDGFLGVVTSETSPQNPWVVTVELNKVPVEFHINTGAEVTVITEDLRIPQGWLPFP